MQFFLEQAEKHLERGLEHQRLGRLKRARFELLKSSEYLFRAAEKSEGRQREIRLERAEALLARASELADAGPSGAGRATLHAGEVEPPQAVPGAVAVRPRQKLSDVAGLDEVKERIRTRLIYPFTHPELAARFGVRAGGGILLYGPPGTGKTLLGRAVAGEVDAPFYVVKPSEIMSKWVGEAEKNIAALFAAARSHPRAVLFVDEMEALVPRRGTNSSTVMARVVPQILAEMDGFEQRSGALLFIGATNEPWALDDAVLRPGRLDEKIYVPLPDAAARRRILELQLDGRPLAPGLELDALNQQLEGFSGADIMGICTQACDIPFVESVRTGEERPVELRDFLTVIARTGPSVGPRQLQRFESYRSSLGVA